MKYLSNNNGTLYYQRRFPLALVEAMGRKLFKMPLHLKPDAPDRDKLVAWDRANNDYEGLVAIARSTNVDVLKEVELDKRASAWLRSQGLDVGALAAVPEAADHLIDIDDTTRKGHPQWDGEKLTAKEQVKARAYQLVTLDQRKKQYWLSDCLAIYAAEKGLDVNSRMGAKVERRWIKWLGVAGDALINADAGKHIEAGLDTWVEQRQSAGVRGSTIQRELNDVLGIIRTAVKKRRFSIGITPPEIRGGSTHEQRATLTHEQQRELVKAAKAEGGSVGVALLLGLSTGMIGSEMQRLSTDKTHLDSELPHLVISGSTKTEARKRVIPVVLEAAWISSELKKLEDGSGWALGRGWHNVTESAVSHRLTKRVRAICSEGTAYSMRHSFRANAGANGANTLNAALIGGWTSGGGVSAVMLTYGRSGLAQSEVIKGLRDTALCINRHLLSPST